MTLVLPIAFTIVMLAVWFVVAVVAATTSACCCTCPLALVAAAFILHRLGERIAVRITGRPRSRRTARRAVARSTRGLLTIAVALAGPIDALAQSLVLGPHGPARAAAHRRAAADRDGRTLDVDLAPAAARVPPAHAPTRSRAPRASLRSAPPAAGSARRSARGLRSASTSSSGTCRPSMTSPCGAPPSTRSKHIPT